jgi:hypothetical protein
MREYNIGTGTAITEIQNKLQKRKWEGSCILTVNRYRLLIIAGSFADD